MKLELVGSQIDIACIESECLFIIFWEKVMAAYGMALVEYQQSNLTAQSEFFSIHHMS